MININSLTATYNFGEELSKTSEGISLWEKYDILKAELSSKTWFFYQKAIDSCAFSHYFSFEHAYKKIEILYYEKNETYQECYIELRDCKELKQIIKEASQIGAELDSLILHTLQRVPLKDNEGLLNSYKLYRSWMDLFYQLHSTKMLAFLQECKKLMVSSDNNYHIFSESKNKFPFSKFNRSIINNLAKNDLEKEMLMSFEFFDSIRNLIPQLIFDTHFRRLFKLEKNDVVYYKEKMKNNIRAYLIEISVDEFQSHKGDFIFLFEGNKLKDIGVIKKEKIEYNEIQSGYTLKISGILYPEKDFDLLIPTILRITK